MVSHLGSPHKTEDLEGGAWGLCFCVLDRRLMLTNSRSLLRTPAPWR